MNKDMARIMATAGLRAGRELGELVRLLNEHEPDSKDLKLGIASVVAEIGFAVMDPAYDADPELKAEFEGRIERYGRAT